MKFHLITLMIIISVVAIAIVPCGEYVGLITPTRQVVLMVETIESLQDSISYEEFVAQTGLPEGAPIIGVDLDGHYCWQLKHGYRLDAYFDGQRNGKMQTASIVAFSAGGSRGKLFRFVWSWVRGESPDQHPLQAVFSQ